MPEELAYISVTKTGFVDGACFTESHDATEWVELAPRLPMQSLPRSRK